MRLLEEERNMQKIRRTDKMSSHRQPYGTVDTNRVNDDAARDTTCSTL